MKTHLALRFFMGASLAFLAPISASSEIYQHNGKVLLFGNLHAHSGLSDDVTVPSGKDWSPRTAYQFAMDGGVDFLAISDHHKAPDSPGKEFSLTKNEYEKQLFEAAMKFNSDNEGFFVAIPAIEWGNTATGNHINVFGAPSLPPRSIKDKDYDDLLAWATGNAEFVQFNHPYSWSSQGSKRDKSVGNFGEALYPSPEGFVSANDSIVKTVTVIASVAGGHLGGEDKHSVEKVHREIHSRAQKHYLEFLNMGFHISPSANQDTHWENWGVVTAARTAVWAEAFNYRSLMDAIKANRVYATEDDELALAMTLDVDGKTYWMGEVATSDKEETDAILKVFVDQHAGADGDETEEGPYSIRVFVDESGVGGGLATNVISMEGVPQGTEVEIPIQMRAGQYVFVEVEEQNGRDNPDGEGEDDRSNATDTDGPDGFRDDMNDRAITSPIWIALRKSGSAYVWSRNSNLYHDADCWAVSRIGDANKRESPTPPEGKEKHSCK